MAVSDYDNKCVSLFDLDGKFQCRLGAGKMLGPKGITTTADGDIIVIDNKVYFCDCEIFTMLRLLCPGLLCVCLHSGGKNKEQVW